jgi:hypothetical protein
VIDAIIIAPASGRGGVRRGCGFGIQHEG